MIVFPAVDIQGGKAVRLKRGKKEEVTVFGDDPVEMARFWRDKGAAWLHVVDLDGAFAGKRSNSDIIGSIVSEVGIPVQVGGGIRSLEAAGSYLEAGATRLIVGTIALENPKVFSAICKEFPRKIGVSLDGVGGRLKTRGWAKDAGAVIEDAIPFIESAGASFLIYTDIERDGTQTGINSQVLKRALRASSLPVIAAGGVSTLDDVKAVFNLRNEGVLEGLISGKALYEGSLKLEEAMDWINAQKI